MAQNQEQIESLLCGYVDDTLSPSERAEIEAHLNAHPQHRHLLAELRQMRDTLRSLPREPAPGEMSESFTGQLERSVLLEGIDDAPAPARMRIVRWPQLAAVAAIVLLAGALAMVLLYALTNNRPGAQFARQTATPTPAGPDLAAKNVQPATEPAADFVGSPRSPASDGPTTHDEQSQASPSVAAAIPPAPPDHADRFGEAPHNQVEQDKDNAKLDNELKAEEIARSVLSIDQVQALLGRANADQKNAGGDRPVVVMVVTTTAGDDASRKLGNYCETNKTDWQQTVVSGEGQLAGPLGGTERRDFGFSDAKDGQKAAAGGRASGSTNAPATMPTTQAGALADANRPQLAQQMENSSTQRQPGLNTQNQQMQSPLAGALAQARIIEPGTHCYVLRNVSYQQATQLNTLLRDTAPGTQAPLFADQREANDKGANFGSSKSTPPAGPMHAAPASAATRPATQPEAPLANDDNESKNENDALSSTQPQTMPADAAEKHLQPIATGIVPINGQSMLGSSPVDLVVVIKEERAVPAPSAPATNPATAPATEPATQPAQ